MYYNPVSKFKISSVYRKCYFKKSVFTRVILLPVIANILPSFFDRNLVTAYTFFLSIF